MVWHSTHVQVLSVSRCCAHCLPPWAPPGWILSRKLRTEPAGSCPLPWTCAPGVTAAPPSSASHPGTHTRLQWSAPRAEVSGNRQAEKENIKLRVRCYFSWSPWLTWDLSRPLPSWKSSQLTLRMMSGVRARNPFTLQSTAHELMDAVSPPAWLGVRAQACHPKTHFQNSAQDTCSSLIYITLTRSYSKMDFSEAQGCMFWTLL